MAWQPPGSQGPPAGMPPIYPPPGVPGVPPPGVPGMPPANFAVPPGVPPPYGLPPPGMLARPPLNPGMPPPFVPAVARPPTVVAIQKQATTISSAPTGVEEGPRRATTLYVGKIAPTVEDSFVQEVLAKCGKVRAWKPALDLSTKKPKGFGFCEFEDADGTQRALRLLNGFAIDGKELLVKPNKATQEYLDWYNSQQDDKKKGGSEDEQGVEDTPAEEKPEEVDATVRQGLLDMTGKRLQGLGKLTSGDSEVNKPSTDPSSAMKALEADFFSQNTGPPKPVIPPPPPLTKEDIERMQREKEADREKREAERQEREREREKQRREREKDTRRREEQRKYEEKERNWERIEREVHRMLEREQEREAEQIRERKKQVLEEEDLSDEDWKRKRLRGRSLEERKRKRLREIEEDEVDKIKEVEEIKREAERAALEKIEAEKRRLQEEKERKLKEEQEREAERLRKEAESAAAQKEKEEAELAQQREAEEAAAAKDTSFFRATARKAKPAAVPGNSGFFESNEDDDKMKRPLIPIEYSEEEMKTVAEIQQSNPLTAAAEYARELSKQKELQDEKELAKALAKEIPSTAEDLDKYAIGWDTYDSEKATIVPKLTAFIKGKMRDLLGLEDEEEMFIQDVVDFIMEKIDDHIPPKDLVPEMEQFIDNEAATFVLKFYRALIFEILREQRMKATR